MELELYFGGDILTMEDSQPTVESILIEDGRIKDLGGKEEILSKYRGAIKEIDLEGKTLMPSFIDPHSHFMGYANSLLQVGTEDARSIEEIIDLIVEFIDTNSLEEGEWVLARGFDHNNFEDKRVPTKEDLDRASSKHPIVLQHRSGHTGVFNTMALEKLNINENTEDPEGGSIVREDGKITGYLEENAFLNYLDKLPKPNLDNLMDAVNRAQKIYAKNGITTIQEGMITDSMTQLYDYLCSEEKLFLDVVGYGDLRGCDIFMDRFKDHIGSYKNNFKLAGYKMFLDGSPQARTAWMREEYLDSDGYTGYPILTDDNVRINIKRAIDERLQILAHCNGDKAAEQYINAFKYLSNKGVTSRDIRPVLIHGQLLGIDQLDDLKELDIMPSFFIGHVYYWGDTHIRNFGYERGSRISPMNSALKRDIRFTIHQDTPVTEPNMIHSIWSSVNRITKSGHEIGKEERISRMEALKAATINGAYQYFEEDKKGSFKIGKNADMIILSENPLEIENILDLEVLETRKDGKLI